MFCLMAWYYLGCEVVPMAFVTQKNSLTFMKKSLEVTKIMTSVREENLKKITTVTEIAKNQEIHVKFTSIHLKFT